MAVITKLMRRLSVLVVEPQETNKNKLVIQTFEILFLRKYSFSFLTHLPSVPSSPHLSPCLPSPPLSLSDKRANSLMFQHYFFYEI